MNAAQNLKPLVLCADDYAQEAGVSHAIVQLARQGQLSATSAMVLSPRWPQD
ncbi:MAG: ChbG/HpnK family deacetylase, partial [Comamonas sp.]